MNAILSWIVLVVLTIVVVVVLICLIRKPMHSLLTANSYMTPARQFYERSFKLVMILAALAAVVGADIPSIKQAESKVFIEWVWWVADKLAPVFWSVSLFLIGYVLLLTILFAVLGRYHDK